jgi:hypothetical protein
MFIVSKYMTSVFTVLLVSMIHSHLSRVRFLVGIYYLVSNVTLVYMYVQYIQDVSKIHGITSQMNSSYVDNKNSLYQLRSGNAQFLS